MYNSKDYLSDILDITQSNNWYLYDIDNEIETLKLMLTLNIVITTIFITLVIILFIKNRKAKAHTFKMDKKAIKYYTSNYVY